MTDGLRLALTTLTVLPVRGPERVDRRVAGQAMLLAPAVGLLLGLAAAAVMVGSRLLTPPTATLLASALAVGALAVASRGLHLDGLADTVDGLASYLPPEQARAVMKKPDLGPLGMAAVVLVLLVQVAALEVCIAGERGTLSLLLAVVTARVAVAAACTSATRAATTSGLGALVAGTVPRGAPLALALVTAAAAAVVGRLDEGSALQPVIAVGLGLCAAAVLRRHAVRRFGGLTGDVLGALVETATTVVLLVMAVQVDP